MESDKIGFNEIATPAFLVNGMEVIIMHQGRARTVKVVRAFGDAGYLQIDDEQHLVSIDEMRSVESFKALRQERVRRGTH